MENYRKKRNSKIIHVTTEDSLKSGKYLKSQYRQMSDPRQIELPLEFVDDQPGTTQESI